MVPLYALTHGPLSKGSQMAARRKAAKPTGWRYNKGKLPWKLAAWDAIEAVVEVWQVGAEKYAPRNWEGGFMYDEVFDSAMRHLISWFRGQDYDDETGCLHLAHASWNVLVLLAFTLRGRKDLDNRPKSIRKVKGVIQRITTSNVIKLPVRKKRRKAA